MKKSLTTLLIGFGLFFTAFSSYASQYKLRSQFDTTNGYCTTKTCGTYYRSRRQFYWCRFVDSSFYTNSISSCQTQAAKIRCAKTNENLVGLQTYRTYTSGNNVYADYGITCQ